MGESLRCRGRVCGPRGNGGRGAKAGAEGDLARAPTQAKGPMPRRRRRAYFQKGGARGSARPGANPTIKEKPRTGSPPMLPNGRGRWRRPHCAGKIGRSRAAASRATKSRRWPKSARKFRVDFCFGRQASCEKLTGWSAPDSCASWHAFERHLSERAPVIHTFLPSPSSGLARGRGVRGNCLGKRGDGARRLRRSGTLGTGRAMRIQGRS